VGQQENLYTDNLKASVAVLKKLIGEWKERSVKLTPAETLTLNQTMKSLRQKVSKLIFFYISRPMIHYSLLINC